MKVRTSEQVVGFVKSLAPVPRRRLKAALKNLAKGKGDFIQLEEPLAGYHRLRTGGYRVIFKYGPASIDCLYAERRSLVYEVFEKEILKTLTEKKQK